jgi:hypothetical protein
MRWSIGTILALVVASSVSAGVMACTSGGQVGQPSQVVQMESSIQPLVKDIARLHPGQAAEVVTALGRWRLTSPSDTVRLPTINSVEITCSKMRGTCVEVAAFLHTASDGDFEKLWGSKVTLRPRLFEYNVVEWTADAVRAQLVAPIATIELLIWPERGVAERTFRETPDSKGEVFLLHWLLQ